MPVATQPRGFRRPDASSAFVVSWVWPRAPGRWALNERIARTDEPERLIQRIAETISSFERRHMSVSPAAVAVSLGSDAVVVTLRGVTAPAEREYARDRDGRRLLERFYEEVFDASRPVFEAAVSDILSRSIERSKLSVDAASGSAVIIVTLGPARRETGE